MKKSLIDYELIICDLDGTLSDDRHRVKYLPAISPIDARVGDFHAYHSVFMFDDVLEGVANLLKTRANRAELCFLTNRFDRFRGETKDWLVENNVAKRTELTSSHRVKPAKINLYMRYCTDNRPSLLFKLDKLHSILNEYGPHKRTVLIDNDVKLLSIAADIYKIDVVNANEVNNDAPQ